MRLFFFLVTHIDGNDNRYKVEINHETKQVGDVVYAFFIL